MYQRKFDIEKFAKFVHRIYQTKQSQNQLEQDLNNIKFYYEVSHNWVREQSSFLVIQSSSLNRLFVSIAINLQWKSPIYYPRYESNDSYELIHDRLESLSMNSNHNHPVNIDIRMCNCNL